MCTRVVVCLQILCMPLYPAPPASRSHGRDPCARRYGTFDGSDDGPTVLAGIAGQRSHQVCPPHAHARTLARSHARTHAH